MHTRMTQAGIGLRPGSQWGSTPMGRGSRVGAYAAGFLLGGLFTGLAAYSAMAQGEGGVISEGPSVGPVAPAAAQLADPPCGFDVYRGKLYVTALGRTQGEVMVWLGDRLVRSGRSIAAGDTEVFALKRRHTSADFTVAVVAVGRKHNDEHVSWCAPA